ncbi:MAG: cupin domain-containing protein [Chloroflexota bacterium]|tara:strand:+ start:812 stop:1141 length:330 start_codon:yes stop_codon:yes gene_type:complete
MPIFDQNDLEPKEIHPGVFVRLMWGENIMMMLVDIAPHAEVPTHTHLNEQAGRVLSGSFKLIIDGEERLLTEGDHYLIPSNVPHSAHGTETSSLALDLFSPPREDYKKL